MTTTNLTESQITALAPDPASAKAGRDLANPRKWSGLGLSERAVWGECQGSGKLPYQAQIDRNTVAFKCTCPSRKFPCKHGLGLGLILAAQPSLFAETAEPDWVTKWISGRETRTERKQQRDESAAPPDPEAQAKRAAAREHKVAGGVEQLELWLRDLLRLGLASAPSREYAFWDGMAARLVDAQATGLARMVRELGSLASSGQGWEDRFLDRVGSLVLAIEGFRRLESDADVRTVIGYTTAQSDVLALPGVTDDWIVVGRAVDAIDRLKVQRSWLQGRETAQTALILDFAAAGGAVDTSLPTGVVFQGEVVYFSAAVVGQRALIKARQPVAVAFRPAAVSLGEAHAAYRRALAVSPWIETWPMLLQSVTPEFDGAKFVLRDNDTAMLLPLQCAPEAGWQLLAVSGGQPVTLFGEWNGRQLRPLTWWREDGQARELESVA